MNRADLIGYVRKSATGNALKLNINRGAFSRAETYTGRDGEEYVGLIVSLDKVKMLIGDQKEVTSICQIVDIDEDQATIEEATT